MRIVLIFGSFRGGGVARVMLRLGAALVDRGIDVDMVVARRRGDLVGEIPPQACVHELAAASALAAYRYIFQADPSAAMAFLLAAVEGAGVSGKVRCLPSLVRTLGELHPDAVLAATAPFNLIALWARTLTRLPMRVVVSEHNILARPDKGEKIWRYGLSPSLLSRSYARADAVVGVSRGVADELRATARIAGDRLSVIYNPVFDGTLASLGDARPDHPWLTDGGPPVILGVGKLYAPGKDFPNLIRAFAHLRKQRPCRLIILGDKAAAAKDDKQLTEVLSLPGRLGVAEDVCFPGFIANPFAWMRRASVFALSSAWEGLSLAVIEAMAMGCPVVSTDCPHGPNEILQGGRYGPLVPVGDPVALATGIARTLDSPLGADLLRRRANDFSVERSVDGYLRLLLPNV